MKGANFFGAQPNTNQTQAKTDGVESGPASPVQASSPTQAPYFPQSQPSPVRPYPVENTAPTSRSDEWYYASEGKQLGPVPFNRIAHLVSLNMIKTETLVWHEGRDQWISAGLTELKGLFPHRSSPPPLPINQNIRRQEPPPAALPTEPQHNSGQGTFSSAMPTELQGYNWGALLIGFFWSIAHSTWIGLLGIAIYMGGYFIFGAVVAQVVSLCFYVWLGAMGNQFAWQNRRWNTLDEFKEVQKKWMQWGIVFFVLSFVLGIIGSSVNEINRQAARDQALANGDFSQSGDSTNTQN